MLNLKAKHLTLKNYKLAIKNFKNKNFKTSNLDKNYLNSHIKFPKNTKMIFLK